MMKKNRERVIYDNYDIWENFHEDAKEALMDEEPGKEPSDNEIWDLCYQYDDTYYEYEKDMLDNFFNNGSTWLLVGKCGSWDGTFAGGFAFKTYSEMISKVAKDCDYIKLWDENGLFCGKCSHHDGTNTFEIKKLTKAGERLLDNWSYAYNNKRYNYSEEELHKKLWNNYSILPNFAHETYGCKKKEYEEI